MKAGRATEKSRTCAEEPSSIRMEGDSSLLMEGSGEKAVLSVVGLSRSCRRRSCSAGDCNVDGAHTVDENDTAVRCCRTVIHHKTKSGNPKIKRGDAIPAFGRATACSLSTWCCCSACCSLLRRDEICGCNMRYNTGRRAPAMIAIDLSL